VDYVFHLEDDWKCCSSWRLGDVVSFLKTNPRVMQVNLTHPDKSYEGNPYTYNYIGDYWEWLFDETQPRGAKLFLDKVEADFYSQQHPEVQGYWQYYVNWVGFGFPPSVTSVKRFATVENIEVGIDDFEAVFAEKVYDRGFTNFSHRERIFYHLDQELTSYELNNSTR